MNHPFECRSYLTNFLLILYIVPCYCAHLLCFLPLKFNKDKDFKMQFRTVLKFTHRFTKNYIHTHSHTYVESSFT